MKRSKQYFSLYQYCIKELKQTLFWNSLSKSEREFEFFTSFLPCIFYLSVKCVWLLSCLLLGCLKLCLFCLCYLFLWSIALEEWSFPWCLSVVCYLSLTQAFALYLLNMEGNKLWERNERGLFSEITRALRKEVTLLIPF